MANDVKYPVNAGFFNAINNDRTYSADDMNRPYRKLISNVVFATSKGTASNELQVFSADSGMNVIVSKGDAIIGDKWFENPSDLIITISQNSELTSRIDSIIAQIDRTQSGRLGAIIYRQGNASSNPVHPNINTEEDIFELRLADIIVSPSCVKITQDLITDSRGSSECPWITSLIKQVDTSTLYAQWQAAYKKYYEEQGQEFDEWFESIKGQLDEDAATKLAQDMEEYIKNINIENFNNAKTKLTIVKGNGNSEEKEIVGVPSCNEKAQKQIGFYYIQEPQHNLGLNLFVKLMM